MNLFFDDYLVALSNWAHVRYLVFLYLLLCVPSALGFIYFWCAGVIAWFRALRHGLRQPSSQGPGPGSANPFIAQFKMAMLKGTLVWLIAGWPLVLVTAELASAEAFEIVVQRALVP